MKTPRSKSYLYEYVDGVVVVAHALEQPSDEDWTAMVDWMRAMERDTLDVLVSTESAGPNARQRAALVALPCAKKMRLAVMTPSVVVRGIVTALGWLGIPIRPFASGDLQGAADFLELSGVKRAQCLRTMHELRAQVAGATSYEEAKTRLRADGPKASRILFETSLVQLRRRLDAGRSIRPGAAQ